MPGVWAKDTKRVRTEPFLLPRAPWSRTPPPPSARPSPASRPPRAERRRRAFPQIFPQPHATELKPF